jgi:hypothetical protein
MDRNSRCREDRRFQISPGGDTALYLRLYFWRRVGRRDDPLPYEGVALKPNIAHSARRRSVDVRARGQGLRLANVIVQLQVPPRSGL